MNRPDHQSDFHIIVFSSLCGTATEEQKAQLAQMLEGDAKLRDDYAECVIIYTLLHRRRGACICLDDAKEDVLDEKLWESLAFEEKTARAIEISKEKPQRELIQKVIYPPKAPYKFPTSSVVTALVSTAAFLILMAYVYFSSPRGESVASLNRMVNAKWSQDDSGYHEGQTLYPGAMTLLEGQVELLFDSGATVIVEAPAEFTIEKMCQLYLESGRLVARIDSDYTDEVFVVRSAYSCVVDYGTEFGVQVDASGMETVVFEGNIDVREGADHVKFTRSVLLEAGEGAVSKANQPLQRSAVDGDKFVTGDKFELYCDAANGSRYAKWFLDSENLHRDRSLVAHYTFELNAAYPGMLINTAADANQSTFGLLGEADYNAPMFTQGRWPGKKAMQFERKFAHRIRVPADPKLCIGGEVTIGVWMKLSPISSGALGGHILCCRAENGVNYQLSYFKEYDSDEKRSPYRIQFLRRQMENNGAFLSSDEIEIDTQQWHFVAVTHDTEQVRYYVDGKLLCQAPFAYSNEKILHDLYIGDVPVKNVDYSDRRFHGLLDEIMIFDRALSEAEVKQMYLSGKP